MNSHQNKSSSSRPGIVHSTRSNFETFDQATKDSQLLRQQQQQQEQETAGSMSSSTTHGRDQQQQQRQRSDSSSAVQLDRDVQHSRKAADENRQKASGNARPSNVERMETQPYVE
ncbi:hypothetical protein BG004_004386 [Podila humilis]|nr:hypothetical protein BG004_004386 [Podila humilis]